MSQTAKRARTTTPTQLQQLKNANTIIVADTGDIGAIKELAPQDATTNPTLLYKAIVSNKYPELVKEAIELSRKYADEHSFAYTSQKMIDVCMDYLYVIFGREILKVIPADGLVSTEIDARLSFDTQGTIERGERLIGFYKQLGVDASRVLLKVASTYEGIQAVKVLEYRGMKCNCTLLFSLVQAVAAADAGAFLVSPFVGRITDWFMKNEGRKDWFPVEQDPGVLSVRRIYNYYKQHDIKTIVMGASFRHKGQIVALAGCDRLTISPTLIKELEGSNDIAPARLSEDIAIAGQSIARVQCKERDFRWEMNEDAMGSEKLAEGIRNFAKDACKCEVELKKMLA